MKKNILALFVSVFLVCFFVAPAIAVDAAATFGFTANVTDIPDSDPGGSGISGLQFSPNVEFAYDGSADGNNYSMATYNTKGTKTYAVANSYAGIYVTVADVTSGTVPPAASSSPTYASATWTEVAR